MVGLIGSRKGKSFRGALKHLPVKRFLINAQDVAMRFIDYIETIVESAGKKPILFINMDETPVYFDMPDNHTFDFAGVKEVPLKTTGNEKRRCTAVLTCMSDGRKGKPMVILKDLKKKPVGNFNSKAYVTASDGGSMNERLMYVYIDAVLKHLDGKESINSLFNANRSRHTLFTMDSYSAHKILAVMKKIQSKPLYMHTGIIPAGMTPILQPLDLSINKTFKKILRRLWKKSYVDGPVELTAAGHRKRMSYFQIVDHIVQAWDEIPAEMIIKSFKSCAMSVDRSGLDYNHRLMELITRGTLPDKEPEEKSGMTDDEEVEGYLVE